MSATDNGPFLKIALWRYIELFAVTGLALVQPLLSLYSRNPTELVEYEITGLPIVWFVLIALMLPPATLLAFEALVFLVSREAADRLHKGMLAALLAAFVIQLVPVGPVTGWLALLAGAGVAVLFWRSWDRLPSIHTWIHALAVMPLVVAGLFLVDSQVGQLAFGDASVTDVAQVPDDPPSVVMVVLDELPTGSLLDSEGMIDDERFPTLASLAADGTWYRNNVTTAGWTTLAIPQVVTGQYPDPVSNIPHNSVYPENLFALFDSSHEMVVVETVTQLCPPDVCPRGGAVSHLADFVGAAAGLWRDKLWPFSEPAIAFEPVGDSVGHVGVESAVADVTSRVIAADNPTFTYLHIPVPHQPWNLTPTGETYETDRGWAGLTWPTEGSAASGRQQHLLQTSYTDRVLGELVSGLREAGLYDETAIVVTGDHGVSFEPGQPARVSADGNIDAISHTPLIVKAPGQDGGGVDDDFTQVVDIVPTLAGIVGIEIPWAVDGFDLGASPDLTDRERRFYPVWIDELTKSEDSWAVLPRHGLLDVVPPEYHSFDGVEASYLVGGTSPLSGIPVSQLEIGPPEELAVKILEADRLLEGDLSDDLPLSVSVKSAEEIDADLAIVVNGVVGATGRVTDADDLGWRLRVVLPSEVLSNDGNEVEVFAIRGEPGAPVLHPVPVEFD